MSLHYENAWWDKAQSKWTTLGFHIIESFKLASEGSGPRNQTELPLSPVTWNDDVFRSFQAGYLKQLDLEFYLDLTCRPRSESTASSTSGSITETSGSST